MSQDSWQRSVITKPVLMTGFVYLVVFVPRIAESLFF